jgi:hypothetical protein
MVSAHVSLLLRVGLAFSLIYPAVAAFYTPTSWIGFFPSFVQDIVGNDEALTYLLHGFGVLEIVLGLWILTGRNIFYPSTAVAWILFFIVAFNISLLDILFRDIPIMLMALALALMHKPLTKGAV